jgi:hypothetical protein
MLVLEAVPAPGRDAYKLLRTPISRGPTWEWINNARTRIGHVQLPNGGDIALSNAGGVLVAAFPSARSP